MSTADTLIAACAAMAISKAAEQLKSAPSPLPYGLAQKFAAMVPAKTPEAILEQETNPFWHWYAVELQEYIDLLCSIPKQAFVEKRKKS
jgi:hypothetical protein